MPENSEETENSLPPEAQGEINGSSEAEQSLPPEARGETNGGPLGCCLGVMVGLLLSLSLALLSRAYATSLGDLLRGNYWLLGLLVRILMGVMAFACAVIFGYLGWRLGKRFFREYEPPVRKSRAGGRSR